MADGETWGRPRAPRRGPRSGRLDLDGPGRQVDSLARRVPRRVPRRRFSAAGDPAAQVLARVGALAGDLGVGCVGCCSGRLRY